jgi:hypothetical protein
MTKERWSRVRSLTLAALRDLGVDMMPGRDVGGVSPAWKDLRERISVTSVRLGLSRFMSFCTRNGIEPDAVAVDSFEAFSISLKTRSLKTNPEALYRATVQFWNRAAETVSGWPQVQISVERHPRFYSLDWNAFPPSFVADVEAFLTSSGSDDAFAEDYVRAMSPKTVELRRGQLRQMATSLVHSGFDIAELTSLAVLVEPANGNASLRQQRDRDGGKTTPWLAQKAWLLSVIARHWVKRPAHADELRELAKRLPSKQSGMTARNRLRLRQFDVPKNVQALLASVVGPRETSSRTAGIGRDRPHPPGACAIIKHVLGHRR